MGMRTYMAMHTPIHMYVNMSTHMPARTPEKRCLRSHSAQRAAPGLTTIMAAAVATAATVAVVATTKEMAMEMMALTLLLTQQW